MINKKNQYSKTIFLIIALLLIVISQLRAEENVLVKKNPFSPNRQYLPAAKEDDKGGPILEKEFEKNIILRGTYILPNKKWAILELKPVLQRKLEIKKKQIILEEGGSLNNCILKKIEEGKVLFTGSCNLELSLRDNPERNLPPETSKPIQAQNPFLKALKSKSSTKKRGPKQNPFKALLEKKRGNFKP